MPLSESARFPFHHPAVCALAALGLIVGGVPMREQLPLWLNLRDVFWERQGRASMNAILLFGALLSTGIFGGRFFQAARGGREFERTRSD